MIIAISALALVQLLAPSAVAQGATQIPATIRNAMLKGGVALVFGCYDSDHPDMDEFDAELPVIAAAGIGHVRYTCSMDVLENGTTGRVRDDRYAKVLEFVNLAWSYGLVTTVDVHNMGMRECAGCDWTNNYMWGVGNPQMEARHTGVVTDLAARLYRDVPRDRFVFQPANEPIDQPTWYDYQRRMFSSIRSACPDCTIMVMASDWQGVESTVYNLDVSSFSQPFIVDVHFYDPLGLTHCSFPGQANTCPGKNWPGNYDDWRGTTYYDKAWVASYFAPLWQWRDQRGVFVNIGEFGTAEALNEDVRARYLGDVASIFRANGSGFTAFEWYRNFGIKQHPKVVSAMFSNQGNPQPTAVPPTTVPETTAQPTTVPPTTVAPTAVVPTQPVPTQAQPTARPTQIVGGPTEGAVISSFTLINTDTQQPVAGFDPIPAGATISLPVQGWNYALRANVSGTPGSVVFGVNGQTNYSVDPAAPYSLDGENGGVYYNSWLGNGTHTITATPFSGAWASGTPGVTYSLTLTITDQPVQQPPTTVAPTAVVPTTVPPTTVPPTAVVPTTVPQPTDIPVGGGDLLVRATSSTQQALPGETIYIDLVLENPQLAGGGSILALEANCALQPVGILFGQTVSGGPAFGQDAVTVNTSFRPDSTFTYATSQTNGTPVTSSGVVMTATVAALGPGSATLSCTITAINGNRENVQVTYEPVSILVSEAPAPTSAPATTVPPTAVPPTQVPPTAVPPTAVPPTQVSPTVVVPTQVEPTVDPDVCTETTGTISGVALRSHAADDGITVSLLDSNGQVVATATTEADGSFVLTGVPAGTYSIVAEAESHLPAQGTLTVADCLTTSKPEVVLPAGYLVLKEQPVIDELDVVQLAVSYGQTTGDALSADLDENGRVGIGDLLAIAENLRLTGPVDWGDTQPQ
ncbi:MAG: cellulase family glycosylhydrolase [Anaerolineae bacterium]|nr:cellulase family glycosylhydrolase [Anaerolineae bacterium]